MSKVTATATTTMIFDSWNMQQKANSYIVVSNMKPIETICQFSKSINVVANQICVRQKCSNYYSCKNGKSIAALSVEIFNNTPRTFWGLVEYLYCQYIIIWPIYIIAIMVQIMIHRWFLIHSSGQLCGNMCSFSSAEYKCKFHRIITCISMKSFPPGIHTLKT